MKFTMKNNVIGLLVEKKQLPPNCRFQNRRFTAYALHCLGIIYVAALAAAV
jgi:hypothetical protein